jgi:hypothetical protein
MGTATVRQPTLTQQQWPSQEAVMYGGMQTSGSRVKSGADLVNRENFKTQIAWPHLYYESIECKDKLSFNDLTCDMLAAGEVEIIQAMLENNATITKNGKVEIIGRLSRLKETMYLTNVKGFDRAKRFFELTGKRVEAGGSWDCDNSDIYVRSSMPCVNQNKLDAASTSNNSKSNDERFNFVCMSFNYNDECSFTVKNGKCSKAHVCNKCIRRGETFTHKAKECTRGQGNVEGNPR